jgi:hypothetical protein
MPTSSTTAPTAALTTLACYRSLDGGRMFTSTGGIPDPPGRAVPMQTGPSTHRDSGPPSGETSRIRPRVDLAERMLPAKLRADQPAGYGTPNS